MPSRELESCRGACPARELWEDVKRSKFPVTKAVGHGEQYFGGPKTIYESASNAHCMVCVLFVFCSLEGGVRGRLYEGQANLSLLALFVVKLCMPAGGVAAFEKKNKPKRKEQEPTRKCAAQFLLLDSALARNIRNLA